MFLIESSFKTGSIAIVTETFPFKAISIKASDSWLCIITSHKQMQFLFLYVVIWHEHPFWNQMQRQFTWLKMALQQELKTRSSDGIKIENKLLLTCCKANRFHDSYWHLASCVLWDIIHCTSAFLHRPKSKLIYNKLWKQCKEWNKEQRQEKKDDNVYLKQ